MNDMASMRKMLPLPLSGTGSGFEGVGRTSVPDGTVPLDADAFLGGNCLSLSGGNAAHALANSGRSGDTTNANRAAYHCLILALDPPGADGWVLHVALQADL